MQRRFRISLQTVALTRTKGNTELTEMATHTTVDVRTLPGTRETTAYHGGGLFPILALAPNGDVVAALRGGAGHLGRQARMEIVRSSDAGHTWTPPNPVADGEDDDRDAAFGVSSQGTLVLLYQREHRYDAGGNYQGGLRIADPKPIALMATRSLDSGLTWEEPYPLSFDSLATASFFGKVVSLTRWDTARTHLQQSVLRRRANRAHV